MTLLVLSFSACSSTGYTKTNVSGTDPGAESDAPASTSSETTATSDGFDTSRIEALYWARKDSARSRFTKADVDFMTGMIAHHAQALVMSRFAPLNDAGPAVGTLTSRIINAQQDEIRTMQGWLRDRGQTVPTFEISGTKLMIHDGGENAMHMPGMLTQEQLDELAASHGREFDRLFLKYMIQHHSGAVGMVKSLFATDGAGLDELAFKLASDINADQITEIARMERMLQSYTQ